MSSGDVTERRELSEVITPTVGAAISFTALFALWFFLTWGRAGGGLFPSPGQVVGAAVEIWRNGYLGTTLGQSLAISLQRIAVGWSICVALGVVLGFAMNASAGVRNAIMPWLAFYRPLPPLAYLSLIVLWLGVGELSKTTLLIMAGLPPVMIGALTALQAVRNERVEAFRSMGVGPWRTLVSLYLPTALPAILVSSRIAFGACFAALIGAEMIAANSGIAWMVIAATNRGAVDVALVGVLMMSAIALIVDLALRKLQDRLAPWTKHEQ